MSRRGGDDVSAVAVVIVIISIVVLVIKVMILVALCWKRAWMNRSTKPEEGSTLAMNKFLNDIEREKPIRFTSQQLRSATENFTNLLGSGGFGTVYKGIFRNGVIVAVKVLHGNSDKKIEDQFMAEVSTIGRIHHINLIRLYGFCFERNLRALVYEYMGNGSLDKYLFRENTTLRFDKLHDIAVGTAKGIAYLHEECQQRIVHYDIKPENILLDANFIPKVADFGLAKLCSRENTHITMTQFRGTPGYTAPELYWPYPVTFKCDVYSFGVLLFEIIGRRRNMEKNLPESQQWLPKWVCRKFENGELEESIVALGIEESDKERATRMIKVALWCVQDRPEVRPVMSVVVKMLEGAVEIPTPPFQFANIALGSSGLQLAAANSATQNEDSDSNLGSLPVSGSSFITATPHSGSLLVTGSPFITAAPTMSTYDIEIASSI